MANTLAYDPRSHQSFEQEWRQHHNCTDIWAAQGIIHETLLPEASYSYRFSLQRTRAGMESYSSVHFSLSDITHNKCFEYRASFPHEKDERALLHIDGDSLLLGEAAQILVESDALALRLRSGEFGLDLRLDRAAPPFWYGADGLMNLSARPSSRRALWGCALPLMPAVGRLYFADYSMRVAGDSSFERMWGRFPARQAALHWERFYIFFNSGDQMMLMDFPFGKYGLAHCLPKEKDGFVMKDYQFTAVDFLELEEWRFANGWRLEAPEYRSHPFYLIPLINEQFRLPICRPLLGVFDRDGNRLGFALAELQPGARNELKRIPLSMHYDTPETVTV